jgi:Holliday junction resolvase
MPNRNVNASRGYHWERYLTDAFNYDGWQARRLGGTTETMPDILAVYHTEYGVLNSVMIAIEAKSSVDNYCSVENEQIVRCKTMVEIFKLYEQKYIVLAFKFGNRKRGSHRDNKHYFLVFTPDHWIENINMVICRYDGRITVKYNDDKITNVVLDPDKIVRSIGDLKTNLTYHLQSEVQCKHNT